MNPRGLALCFRPADHAACIRALLEHGPTPPLEAAEIWGPDCEPWRGTRALDAILATCAQELMLWWQRDLPERFTAVTWRAAEAPAKGPRRGCVKLASAQTTIDVAEVCALLGQVPFELCVAASASADWGGAGRRIHYNGPGFGDGLWAHGWMCAFAGSGHDRLVSRRWLEFGPWRVIRLPGDRSIVQFHDLDANDETALAQARLGHQRMGASEIGGYVEANFEWRKPGWSGYEPASGTLLRVVAGRPIEQREMLEAAAVKVHQPLGMPVRQVAYVFFDEQQAREHLHELWLRELEVRTFIDGRERRLDQEYEPTPLVLDWVRRAQDRDGY